jgi:hypothetical protein
LGNHQRLLEFSHYVLTETRRRINDRNYELPDDIRDYGHVIELIGADRSLRTLVDCLDVYETVSMTEIVRAIPKKR